MTRVTACHKRFFAGKGTDDADRMANAVERLQRAVRGANQAIDDYVDYRDPLPRADGHAAKPAAPCSADRAIHRLPAAGQACGDAALLGAADRLYPWAARWPSLQSSWRIKACMFLHVFAVCSVV